MSQIRLSPIPAYDNVPLSGGIDLAGIGKPESTISMTTERAAG